MHQPIENVERPLALLIVAVVLGALIFFGIRHFSKVRQAAKREEFYQSTLRSYRQILKHGVKRKEVEEYLRLKNIEFFRSPDDDITKIGEDDLLSLFCGRPDVFLQLQFTAPPRQEHQKDGDDRQTLEDIEIIRKDSGCI